MDYDKMITIQKIKQLKAWKTIDACFNALMWKFDQHIAGMWENFLFSDNKIIIWLNVCAMILIAMYP